jgi:translation initiation factor IF-3
MDVFSARKLANEKDLDLVEVAPTARPPVCKIMDYGKYRYQESKKLSTKQKKITVKEVKVRPQINEHDLQFKLKNVITMIFRGREIVHAANAQKVFDRITNDLAELANVEQFVRREGNRMTMVLAPKS